MADQRPALSLAIWQVPDDKGQVAPVDGKGARGRDRSLRADGSTGANLQPPATAVILTSRWGP